MVISENMDSINSIRYELALSETRLRENHCEIRVSILTYKNGWSESPHDLNIPLSETIFIKL